MSKTTTQSPDEDPSNKPDQPPPDLHTPDTILPAIHIPRLKMISNAEADARAKRYLEEQRRERIERLERQCNAPKRQWNAKDLDRSSPWGEIEKKLLPRLGKDGLLAGLVGLRGNGKTQLGVEAMRHVIRQLARSAYYVTATAFMADVKATFKQDSPETERDIIQRYSSYLLLIIDEFARRGESEWENNLLFELLNKRYADLKDTILIANQERDEFIKTIGPSLASRMSETGAIIPCEWPSYR